MGFGAGALRANPLTFFLFIVRVLKPSVDMISNDSPEDGEESRVENRGQRRSFVYERRACVMAVLGVFDACLFRGLVLQNRCKVKVVDSPAAQALMTRGWDAHRMRAIGHQVRRSRREQQPCYEAFLQRFDDCVRRCSSKVTAAHRTE